MANSKFKKTDPSRKIPQKSLVLIISGIIFLAISLLIASNSYSSQINPVRSSIAQRTIPVLIDIPKENIHLPISEAEVQNNNWQVSSTGASHLSTSSTPGTKGNDIIYGHNNFSLFGNIRNLTKGDSIFIKTNTKKYYTYVVSTVMTVDPSNMSVLSPTKNETLTIYTCDGLFDTKRFIVKAILKNK